MGVEWREGSCILVGVLFVSALTCVEGLPEARATMATTPNQDPISLLQSPAPSTKTPEAAELLKALLSTKTSKDVNDLPNRNKFILGITSLWMIMPIAHGIIQWFENGISFGQKVVIAALTGSCLSSTMFWFDARRGSVFHKLDKLCAVQYVVCMVLVTALPGQTGRRLSTGVGTFLPSSMIALFLLGDMCFKRSMYDLQLSLHLLFRYVGYWWGHLLLVPMEQNFPAAFITLTVGYFGHIIGFNEVARKRALFLTEDLYWSSCAILTLWILVCGQVHSFVSYGTDSPRQFVQEVVIWLVYAFGLLASVICSTVSWHRSVPRTSQLSRGSAGRQREDRLYGDKRLNYQRTGYCVEIRSRQAIAATKRCLLERTRRHLVAATRGSASWGREGCRKSAGRLALLRTNSLA